MARVLAPYVPLVRSSPLFGSGALRRPSRRDQDRIVRIGLGEYFRPFSAHSDDQSEIVRLPISCSSPPKVARGDRPALGQRLAGNSAQNAPSWSRSCASMHGTTVSLPALRQRSSRFARDARFADSEVARIPTRWHRTISYIPLYPSPHWRLVVVRLTLPEQYGGMVARQESIACVGGARARAISGRLDRERGRRSLARAHPRHGTEEPKAQWLPRLASAGSADWVRTPSPYRLHLARCATRSTRSGDTYTVPGNKTLITHPCRRPDDACCAHQPEEPGYQGLSILLPKSLAGSDADPFRRPAFRAPRVELLGYRGSEGIRDRVRRLR